MHGEGVAPTQALGTAGSRRGSRTMVSRRARSGRSSVTVKKKRKAATALLMLGGRTPVCARWCWKRRKSSAVAVSGERPMNAANARTDAGPYTGSIARARPASETLMWTAPPRKGGQRG